MAAAKLAQVRGQADVATQYLQKAHYLETQIPQFWDPAKGYFVEALGEFQGIGMPVAKTTNADTQVILSILDAADDDTMPIELTDSRLLATVAKYETLFRGEFEVNSNPAFRQRYPRTTAMGRYIEDKYAGRSPFLPEAANDRGNPWVLIQAYWARYYYRVSEQLFQAGKIQIDSTNIGFFQALFPRGSAPAYLKVGVSFKKNSPPFKALIQEIITKADESDLLLQDIEAAGGAFREQFLRDQWPLVPLP